MPSPHCPPPRPSPARATWVFASTEPPGPLNAITDVVVEAVEEAILNAIVAAATITGINRVIALPYDRLQDAMKEYNRTR